MKTPQSSSQLLVEEQGFTLIEVLIALLIMVGAFVTITGAIPAASLIHRAALERETALSLAQFQMEYFLTNPGPYPGDQGTTKSDFVNAGAFPTGYNGSWTAEALTGDVGLTVIVVKVKPPHAPVVEISAIDTTFSNITPGP
jgi:prepilin-type N-terminal cleavage/methylation domain-containing protein